MNISLIYANAAAALAPELWIVAAIILCCLWNQFFPASAWRTPFWCLIGLIGASVSFWQQFDLNIGPVFLSLFTPDKLCIGFGLITCAVGILVVLMTMGYERHFGSNAGEFYCLLMIAILSILFLGGATDLILLFIALETLSICCVLLSGVFKQERQSNEAALKYLLSTAAVTATFLYGLSFLYGLTGSTNYMVIHQSLASMAQPPSLLLVLVMVLLLSAVGFKLSMVPFHMWTPDVYEGAPTPVTAFLSIGSKAGGFVVAIRLLTYLLDSTTDSWTVVVAALAILSMIAGNLIALAQHSFKRMLAYSSIAHVGYILIGLTANTGEGLAAMTFYIIVYGLFNLGAFAGAVLFSNETGSDRIDDFCGLFRKRPWLALGLSVCLLNLAGLPVPPAGFFAKIFVFWSAVQMQSKLGWLMVGTGLLTSVPAIFYYTRVVIKMIVREPSQKVLALQERRPAMPDFQFYPIAALTLCVIGIFACSFIIDPVFKLARDTISPVTHHGELGCLPANFRH